VNREPVAIAGAVTALVNSVIALLVLTGAFTADVGAAVTLIAGNAVALGAILFARSKVTPVETLHASQTLRTTMELPANATSTGATATSTGAPTNAPSPSSSASDPPPDERKAP